jgi:hypothetical protein
MHSLYYAVAANVLHSLIVPGRSGGTGKTCQQSGCQEPTFVESVKSSGNKLKVNAVSANVMLSYFLFLSASDCCLLSCCKLKRPLTGKPSAKVPAITLRVTITLLLLTLSICAPRTALQTVFDNTAHTTFSHNLSLDWHVNQSVGFVWHFYPPESSCRRQVYGLTLDIALSQANDNVVELALLATASSTDNCNCSTCVAFEELMHINTLGAEIRYFSLPLPFNATVDVEVNYSLALTPVSSADFDQELPLLQWHTVPGAVDGDLPIPGTGAALAFVGTRAPLSVLMQGSYEAGCSSSADDGSQSISFWQNTVVIGAVCGLVLALVIAVATAVGVGLAAQCARRRRFLGAQQAEGASPTMVLSKDGTWEPAPLTEMPTVKNPPSETTAVLSSSAHDAAGIASSFGPRAEDSAPVTFARYAAVQLGRLSTFYRRSSFSVAPLSGHVAISPSVATSTRQAAPPNSALLSEPTAAAPAEKQGPRAREMAPRLNTGRDEPRARSSLHAGSSPVVPSGDVSVATSAASSTASLPTLQWPAHPLLRTSNPPVSAQEQPHRQHRSSATSGHARPAHNVTSDNVRPSHTASDHARPAHTATSHYAKPSRITPTADISTSPAITRRVARDSWVSTSPAGPVPSTAMPKASRAAACRDNASHHVTSSSDPAAVLDGEELRPPLPAPHCHRHAPTWPPPPNSRDPSHAQEGHNPRSATGTTTLPGHLSLPVSESGRDGFSAGAGGVLPVAAGRRRSSLIGYAASLMAGWS